MGSTAELNVDDSDDDRDVMPAHPWAYDFVVERFHIEILKEPGDLVLKDGDIATTRAGDLMLNDVIYSANFRLVQGWRFQGRALSNLLDLSVRQGIYRKALDATLNGHAESEPFDPVRGFGMSARWHRRLRELGDEIGVVDASIVTYTSALILIVSGLLLAFKDDLQATKEDWQSAGSLIKGHSLGSIVAAAANNARHNDEWMKTIFPNSKQASSMAVLVDALGPGPSPLTGVKRLSRDVCPEIVPLLTDDSFDVFSSRLFSFTNALTERCSGRRNER